MAIAVAWLTSRVWGLVLFIGAISPWASGRHMPGNALVALGALAPFVGAVPMWRLPGRWIKTLLFGIYHLACAVAMFVFDWAAIGLSMERIP